MTAAYTPVAPYPAKHRRDEGVQAWYPLFAHCVTRSGHRFNGRRTHARAAS